ncbi:hypothetical protein [Paenibacillus sp. KS1]|uniref:hypothetical protein n=1 Tax=Paenibacillus sp. KS1 TaxID=1849249 RepID=UPI0020C7F507|nr:hypothetical protein [Paenibacillus sp. KS1]
MSLYANDFGYKKLASCAYPWKLNQEYDIKLTAEGSTLTLSINGEQLLQHEDDAWSYGMYGVSTLGAARTYYRKLTITEL